MNTTSSKSTILIIDDTPENIDILSETLGQEYRIKAALNGEQGLKVANSDDKPDLILLDVMMPDIDGYQVIQALKSSPITSNIPVIFVTAKISVEDEQRGLEMGAVDYVTKPLSPPIVRQRVSNQLALLERSQALEQQVQIRTNELEDTRLNIIQILGRASEYKDNETGLHVIRMSWYSRILAEAIGANKEWVDLIFKASPMHDVGKIGIPDSILLKPGKLDADEWEEMKLHSQYGAKILGRHDHPLLDMAKEIALYHHEKWDGSGYPQGLKGEAIPLSARIVAIADVFDALTTKRPYKEAWSTEKAIELLTEQSGKHFDKSLVDAFLAHLPEILSVRQKHAEQD